MSIWYVPAFKAVKLKETVLVIPFNCPEYPFASEAGKRAEELLIVPAKPYVRLMVQ